MSILGTVQRPLRVAIVGAGPSGFYSAATLFKQNFNVKVDMFEKLPAPFGLVRYGVAPDHEKIKNVTKIFEKTASDPRFSFFGNVTIGEDITVLELKEFYDVTIFSYGTETDRRLGIQGENLKGCHTATQFIGWYNSNPKFKDCSFDFSQEVVAIIGQGNVALDIARILCSTKEELQKTDISSQAIEALENSCVKEVHLYGRRGPLQVSFTPQEIKEIGELMDCYPVVDPQDLNLTVEGVDSLQLKNLEILKSYALNPQSKNRRRKFVLHFNRTPVEIIGKEQIEKVKFEINEPVGNSDQKIVHKTRRLEEIQCGLFFTSIGYQGIAMPGVPFLSQKGIIPNRLGRILDGDNVISGWYSCGWIGSGASGVIGTNKLRAEETVSSIMEDIPHLPVCENPNTDAVINLLKERNVEAVSFIDWKKIDAHEIMLGLSLGKPREKIDNVSQMLSITKNEHSH
ncbi:MAG: NAD(P)-binding protein [Candidatus Omnitrophica bacterium]|nr:NAD(P)-binding protein [Candidatus Omnitrophota bacterium]